MARKTGLDIKKEILKLLRKEKYSLRMLEKKVNTNYNTIKTHVTELEFLGLVEIVEHEKNNINGKPYKTVKLTKKGREL